MAIRIISASQVRELLPMAECIEVMATAMAAASAGEVALPPRLFAPLFDERGSLGLMPGSSPKLNSYGAKLITLHPHNPERGLPTIQGFVTLFDRDSGSPVALVEGGEITALRTAAASGLATRLLARQEASSCGVFGTGALAVSHIDAMRAVRPVERIKVWGRDSLKTAAFASAQSQRLGLPVQAVADPAEAAACDLICTVTGSPKPILQGDWVKPGSHVNLVGAYSLTTREADSNLIAKARLYVDLLEAARSEAGDLMIPVSEGVISEAAIVGELGQLQLGGIAGRGDAGQITVYKSLGMVAQDLFAADYVYQKALATGVGVSVDLQG
ncbi:ornithine cyclodeaminase family protein [Halioxenophilus sp. WMMB6]|uniref:ornithine cyclodeaminase family protein n=1 Tax=Halioxenophilus sp. WMMB6 TaxID=3073815 RepID=UPI00295EDE83|nr:ornithine cyclodeaminase family protein [Halioxenophilus sp. WMMB6]